MNSFGKGLTLAFGLSVGLLQGAATAAEAEKPAAAEKAQLERRLAEDYVELESASFRDKTEAGIKVDDAKKKNDQASVAKFTQAGTQAGQIMIAARKKGIDYYTRLKSEYPNYSQMD